MDKRADFMAVPNAVRGVARGISVADGSQAATDVGQLGLYGFL